VKWLEFGMVTATNVINKTWEQVSILPNAEKKPRNNELPVSMNKASK